MLARVRDVLFWVHLAAGVGAGLAIFTMSATGALIALQPQILEMLERRQRMVSVPPGAEQLTPAALLEAATSDVAATADSLTITMSSDPTDAAVVSLGRGSIRYVDPYKGTILGEGARGARAVFQWVTEFHRWFAAAASWRPVARGVTGWSTVAFVALIATGAVLWIPRSRNGSVWLRSLTPSWPASPRARDFNWHTVVGFWCAPVLLVLAVSGVVLAFPWANRMLYAVAGTPPPASPRRADAPAGGAQPRAAGKTAAPDFRRIDAAWGDARARIPSWATIAIRIQPRAAGPVSFTITDAAHSNRFARSQLTVSPTGDVLRWEPYTEQPRGQRWRLWARFAHTGELGGLAGQIIAGVASAGAALLAWTGMSLALRRISRTLTRRDAARAA
jgi:uncharacterized iron-regulated membrane protein